MKNPKTSFIDREVLQASSAIEHQQALGSLLNCRLCQSPDVQFLFSIDSKDGRLSQKRFDLAVCNRCQLLYIATERPPQDNILVFQDEAYMDIVRRCQSWRDWNVRAHLERKLICLERYQEPGKILDLGCGDGLFLQVAQRRGWGCYGLEFNRGFALEAARCTGGKVACGKADSIGFRDGVFDSVSMIHVLEHMDHPAEVLLEARRVLRPQGLLYIAIPCLDVSVRSLLMRIPSKSLRRKAFRVVAEIWPPDHLLHFPAATLRNTLERLGFEILDQVFVNNPFSLRVPNFLVRVFWLLSKITVPLLKIMNSGFHYEVLARRR